METKTKLSSCFSQGFRMTLALLLFFFVLGVGLGYGAWRQNQAQVAELTEMFFKNLGNGHPGGGRNRLFLTGWVFINNLQSGRSCFFGGVSFFHRLLSAGMIAGMTINYFEFNKHGKRPFFLACFPGILSLPGFSSSPPWG